MTEVIPLQQVQVGQETSRGTSVTPTHKLMGVESFTITPINDSVMHPELRASLQPGFTTSLQRQEATASLSLQASYEEILYILDGLFSECTPSGTAAPYTWTYNAPTTAAPTPRYQTFVYGGASYAYGAWGAICSNFTLSAESGGLTKAVAEYICTQADEDALDALSDSAINMMLGNHWDLYIDAAGGTIGSTAVASTAFSFELAVNPNRMNVYHLGALNPTGWRDVAWLPTLKLMLELTDGTASTAIEALQADMLDSSPISRQIRLKADNGADETMTVDFAGDVLGTPDIFTDQDGVVALDITFTGKYNSTLGNSLIIAVQNGTSAIE